MQEMSGIKREHNTSTDADLKDCPEKKRKPVSGSSKSNSQEGPEAGSLGEKVQPQQKLSGDQNWDDYFMAVAFLSKLRSKDPSTQVGACIVNKAKQIIAIGYNGLPIGCSDDDFPWGRKGEQKKYPYVCHAAMNAIVNRTSPSCNLKGCTLYTTLSPCTECAKLIIRSGIEKVVWAEEYKEADKTEELVERTRKCIPSFEYRQYKAQMEAVKIAIDLKILGESPSPVAGEGISMPSSSGTQDEKRSADLVIKWEDYHMALASLLSWPFRNQDPGTTVADRDGMGACIVNEERRIVGTGSGSLPNPFGSDPWAVLVQGTDTTGRNYVCHAVMNAILNRTVATLKGCTVYTTIFPCNECAKLIIQSGIQKVVFAKQKKSNDTERKENEHAEKLLYHAGVCHKQYKAWPSTYKKKTKIEIDLTKAATSDAACRMSN